MASQRLLLQLYPYYLPLATLASCASAGQAPFYPGPLHMLSHHPKDSSLKYLHGLFHDAFKYLPVPAFSEAASDHPLQNTHVHTGLPTPFLFFSIAPPEIHLCYHWMSHASLPKMYQIISYFVHSCITNR